MELAREERYKDPLIKRSRQLALRLAREDIGEPEEFDRILNKQKKKRQRSTFPNVSSKKRSYVSKTNNLVSSTEVIQIIVKEQVNNSELDLRRHLGRVTDQALWELGTICPQVISINCGGWQQVSVSGLRSIALGFGERLEKLDLSDCPLQDNMVQMISARFFNLSCLSFRNCAALTNTGMRYVAEGCHGKLKYLDVSGCIGLKDDSFAWIAGTIGSARLPCKNLLSVSTENCEEIKDGALIALSQGCRLLKYVNFNGCWKITDRGVMALAKECRRLQVVHLRGCISIGNAGVTTIGTNCLKLRSINLSKCAKISDKGLEALSAKNLQGLNVAGCNKLTELGIYFVVKHSLALQILNVTGCEEISLRGLEELMRGLPYVEVAKSFTGFRPKDKHQRRKLEAQLHLVKDTASNKVTAAIRGHGTRLYLKREKENQYLLFSAVQIQSWYRGQQGRRLVECIKQEIRILNLAVKLQALYRSHLGSLYAVAVRKQRSLDTINKIFAVRIQSVWRASKVRERNPEVSIAIEQLREDRWVEALSATVVRLQALVRGNISNALNGAKREELFHRSRDMQLASVKIQATVRGMLGKRRLKRQRQWWMREFAVFTTAAELIQSIVRRMFSRMELNRLSQARVSWLLKLDICATKLQVVFRGNRGRELYRTRLDEFRIQTHGATKLQMLFRGSRVVRWRETRFNQLKAKIKQREQETAEEAATSIQHRLDLKQRGHGRDSASEDELLEHDDDEDWQEHWDDSEQRSFFFSPSRNLRSLDKYSDDDFENSIVGQNVRVFDEPTRKWHDGIISKFNRRKKKYRVEFFVPFSHKGHAWVHCRDGEAAMQLYEAGVWSMMRAARVHHLSVSSYSTSVYEVPHNIQEHSDQTYLGDANNSQGYLDT